MGRAAFWTIFTVVALAITIGLLAGSWATLSPHEWGLKWNKVTLKFSDNDAPYTSGRYYVGVGGEFYKLPRKLQYVEFSGGTSLDVWSKDGQNLFLEGSFYYGLRQDKVQDIFYKFGNEHLGVVLGIAAETIRDVATDYNTTEFFTNRVEIDARMTTALADRLFTDAYVNMTLFNLLAIDVPDAFDAAIVNKLITAQEVNTLTELRKSQLARTQISVVNAEATGNITVINATARAAGQLITTSVEAALFQSLQEARATQLALLAADLNFTSPMDVLQYMYTDVLRGRVASSSSAAIDVSKVQVRM